MPPPIQGKPPMRQVQFRITSAQYDQLLAVQREAKDDGQGVIAIHRIARRIFEDGLAMFTEGG